MPTVSEQVEIARRDVLVVPAPELATLVVTGADRETWLNGLLTCDVLKGKDSEAMYGLFVSQKGRVMADVLLVKEPERIVLVVPERVRDVLVAHLEHYLIMEDAELVKGDMTVALAHGPRAGELGGVRYDPTGLGGAILFGALPANVVVGDAAGWQALRLEFGIPAFGVDFDDKTYPQEASLEKRAVSFEKGCYLGQEVVCMLEMRGHVKRKLVSFELDGGGSVAIDAGAAVTDRDGHEIGKVSSAADSPSHGRPVGLAMLKLSHTEKGTELRIGPHKAHVR
jgi:tRNA-modifying protein YgfZ